MSSFNAYPASQVDQLQETVKENASNCAFYEHAAQRFAQVIYDAFSPNVILSRVYFTIPYGNLPQANQSFIDSLGMAKGVSQLIHNDTPILSLMGTTGKSAPWKDRRQSQGHVGIPLCSSSFISEIPMIARLLQEMGIHLSWFDKLDVSQVEKSLTGMSGIFHVDDASQNVDAKGRKIISAQDFVRANGVRSVFGLGTTYIGGVFVVAIIFTSETLTKKESKSFLPVINAFKGVTSRLVMAGKLFAN